MPAITPSLDERELALVEHVLRTAPLAYVAMVEAPSPADSADTARPYVVPMNFAYENTEAAGGEGRLCLHTGPGRKVDALAGNPRVCVSVTAQEQLKLGASPCEDGYLYQSVILEGSVSLLGEDDLREAALRAIVAKYDPGAGDKPFDPRVFAQTMIYAVEVETIGFKERPRRD